MGKSLFNSKKLWLKDTKEPTIKYEKTSNGTLWCPRFMESITYKECDDQRRFCEICSSCSQWFFKNEYVKPVQTSSLAKLESLSVGSKLISFQKEDIKNTIWKVVNEEKEQKHYSYKKIFQDLRIQDTWTWIRGLISRRVYDTYEM